MASQTLTEPTTQESPGPPARTRRVRKPAALVVGLLFIFAPFLAFVLGDRARPIENRKLAAAPSPADGWQFFGDTTAWFTDHIPLRREGIDANTRLSRKVFGQAPVYGPSATGTGPAGVAGTGTAADGNAANPSAVRYPKVVAGTDGWLYAGDDFDFACHAPNPIATEFAQLARLERMVTASGRRFIFATAPNKSTIVPEHLPQNYLGKDCWPPVRERFWRYVAAHPLAGSIDLRSSLERQQEAQGAPIYLQTDSHWTQLGGIVFAQELANALDPTLLKGSTVVHSGDPIGGGDLARLLGEPGTQAIPTWQLERPGVTGDITKDNLIGPVPVRVRNTTTGVPLYPKRTVILGDSFTNASRHNLFALFADVRSVQISVASPQTVAAEVAKAEVVVVEIVERNIIGNASVLLHDDHLDPIAAALGQ
jgi:alginate O-acetyltransferase complex protein AlgJ